MRILAILMPTELIQYFIPSNFGFIPSNFGVATKMANKISECMKITMRHQQDTNKVSNSVEQK
jgi:hypothetical protein